MTLSGTTPIAQILIPTVTFALVGAARTFTASQKNKENWKWAKGKYELFILTAIGAFAGVFCLVLGVEVGGVVFGSIATAAGVVVRESMKIGDDSLEHYETLVDRGVDPFDAAVIGIQHGIENNDGEEIVQALETLMGFRSDVSRENVEERGQKMRDAYEEGGARDALEETGGMDDVGRALERMATEDLEDEAADEDEPEQMGEITEVPDRPRPRVIDKGP